MATSRRGRRRVLADSGTLAAFAATGQGQALFAWYGEHLQVVRDVFLELAAGAAGSPGIAGCVESLERELRLHELSDEGKLWVARIADTFGTDARSSRRWTRGMGTIASARMAAELAARGDAVQVLVDDVRGPGICARLGVQAVQARDLVLEMTRGGALTGAGAEIVAGALSERARRRR